MQCLWSWLLRSLQRR